MNHNCETILQPCLKPARWGEKPVKVKMPSGNGKGYCKPGSNSYLALNALPFEDDEDGLFASDIAHKLNIERSHISYSLGDLFKRGFATRAKVHPPMVRCACYKYWRVQ